MTHKNMQFVERNLLRETKEWERRYLLFLDGMKLQLCYDQSPKGKSYHRWNLEMVIDLTSVELDSLDTQGNEK